MTNVPVLSPPQLARGCSMSLTRMGEDLLKGRPSGRKTWRIKKGQRFEQEGIEGSPRDGLPTCSVNPCGEAWESWSVYSWEPPKLARPSWIWQMHVPLAAEIHRLSGVHRGSGLLPRTHRLPAHTDCLASCKAPWESQA